uniref:Uncharacterized protein n=1 Tax=Arundo donax TaxID=35708 RepID=A0A0A9A2S9_ARUDO
MLIACEYEPHFNNSNHGMSKLQNKEKQQRYSWNE